MIRDAFDERSKGDYGIYTKFNKEDLYEKLKDMKDFIKTIENFIKQID